MNIIRNRRTDLGLSQAELARRVGVSSAHICRIESGKRAPSVPMARKLAAALDVSPVAIMRDVMATAA